MRRGSRHNLTRAEWSVRAREFVTRGTDRYNAKLNPDVVRAIRENRSGWTARQWAEHLGLHPRTIEGVRAYRSWVHVTKVRA